MPIRRQRTCISSSLSLSLSLFSIEQGERAEDLGLKSILTCVFGISCRSYPFVLFLAHKFCKIPFPIFEAGGVGSPDVGFAGEEMFFFFFFFSCFGLGGLGMKERKVLVRTKRRGELNRERRDFGG